MHSSNWHRWICEHGVGGMFVNPTCSDETLLAMSHNMSSQSNDSLMMAEMDCRVTSHLWPLIAGASFSVSHCWTSVYVGLSLSLSQMYISWNNSRITLQLKTNMIYVA